MLNNYYEGREHFGKYRGKVIDNNDPNGLGRVKCLVPEIFGESISVWCNLLVGFYRDSFCIPAVGDDVIIEFESGDVRRPICVGKYFASGAISSDMNVDYPDSFGIVGKTGIKLIFDDKNQRVEMFSPKSGRILFSDDGELSIKSPGGAEIKIDNLGNISVSGNSRLSISIAGNVDISASGNISVVSAGGMSVTSSGVVSVIGSVVQLG